MTDSMTGPELFASSMGHLADAQNEFEEPFSQTDYLRIAQVHAINAQTAMMAQLIDAFTEGDPPYEMDAWREVIPLSPLKECRGKEIRRPACEERHTEDCDYADPPPEPKHVLLDVGTRVLVSDWAWEEPGMFERGERRLRLKNPHAGRISGYDMHRTKYRWQQEYEPGRYASFDSWAFVDNRVEVHPDGPECPPGPRSEKETPA